MTMKAGVLGGVTLALALAAAVAHLLRSPQGRDIVWRHGGAELHGTLYLPDSPGRHPLAVIVPGSGCMPLSHRFYRAHTRELPRRGIAVFAYDKRGCGRSTGDWQDVDFGGLAGDVLSVLPTLVSDSSVDAAGVGLWGLSQGGWVSLIAAGRSPLVKHVVLLSGPPMTPAEQGDEVVALAMREKGIDEAAIAEAVALNRQLTNVYRTDSGWDEAAAALRDAARKSWFEASGVGLIPRANRYWRWLRSILDYDPLPALHDLTIPILAVYGDHDLLVPGPRSRDIITALAPAAMGPRDAVLLRGVGHQLRPGPDTWWPAAYWDTVADRMRESGFLRRRPVRTRLPPRGWPSEAASAGRPISP